MFGTSVYLLIILSLVIAGFCILKPFDVPAEEGAKIYRGTVFQQQLSSPLMLFNLSLEIKEGDGFTFRLIFEKLGSRDVKVRFAKEDMCHHH